MSYNVNLLNPYQYQQYPISYGAAQVDPVQVAGYAQAAINNTNEESKATDGLGLVALFGAVSGTHKLYKYSKATGISFGEIFKTFAGTAKADVNVLKEAVKGADKLSKFSAISNANKTAQSAVEAYASMGKAVKGMATSSETAVAVVNTAAGTAAKTASKSLGSKILGGIKNNALFIAIEGGIEMFTNVIPTFKQLGAKSGMKQVAKSSAKVAAGLVGWKAGAAAGAAIGSIIPGAGTAVGAVIGSIIGTIGGIVGSSLATKAVQKVVGKDELDIAKEKQQQEQQKAQTATISNQQLLQQAGISNPTSTSYASNPFTTNPMLNSYVTQDNSDNLLMMPLRSGLQLTA